ncbi:cell division protein FtsH, partial [Deinococcus multiflagellatus]|nr:cell division protein FtsH [Deinococcus multiflagellatus]
MRRAACLLTLLLSPALAQGPASPAPGNEPYTTNRFFADLQAGQVSRVVLSSAGQATVTLSAPSGPQVKSLLVPPDGATLGRIRRAGVPLQVTAAGSGLAWLGQVLPLLLTALILVVLWRSMRAGSSGNGAASFGRSKASVIGEGQIKLTFADVAGCDEAKTDLQEVVDFLRQPERYHQLGARI